MIRWSRGQIWASVLFVAVAWMWGGAFVAIEIGLTSVPPFWFAGLRYLLAGTVVSAVAVATGRVRPQGRDEWLSIGFVGAFIVAGYPAMLYLGTMYTSGAIAAVVVSLSPVLTTVLAGLLSVGAVVRGEPLPVGITSGPAAGAFAYLVLVAGVLGYLTYFELLSRIGPVRVNLVAYLEPVTAALAGWAVLGDVPTPTTAAGFLLVFCGFALASGFDPLERVRDARSASGRNDLVDGTVEVHPAD